MRNSPANCRAVSLRAFRGDVDLDAFGLFSRLIGCVVRPAEPELHDVFTDRIFTFPPPQGCARKARKPLSGESLQLGVDQPQQDEHAECFVTVRCEG